MKKIALRFAVALALSGPASALQYPAVHFGALTLDAPLAVTNGGLGNAIGDVSNLTVSSGSAARSLSQHFGEVIDVRDYGAAGDGTTDDTAAFAAAINAVNASATGGQGACLTIPKGIFYINGSPLPSFSQNTGGGVCGAGSWRSVIRLGLSYSGDLFSWTDAWGAGVFNTGGTSIVIPQKYGPRVTGLTILGDNAASAQQNALMFYDHNDFVFVSDVDIENLHGRALYAGAVKNGTVAYIRESNFENIRVFNSGSAGVPAFEITAQCTASCSGQDATNEINIASLDIYGSRGPGLVLRNAMPASTGVMRSIRMEHLRVEGKEGASYSGDSIMIGDASMSGGLAGIRCDGCEILSPYTGYAALDINTAGSASSLSNIYFSGFISAGAGGGKGINIGAGTAMFFDLTNLYTLGTGITIASSATVLGPLVFDGAGQERYWTWNVDATSVAFVSNRRGMFGIPTGGAAPAFVSAQVADGGVSFGNARGMNSVDWQTQRFANTQVASGQSATIAGGQNNTASGLLATAGGGLTNYATGWLSTISGGTGNIGFGPFSAIPGGWGALAYDFGMMAFGSGNFSTAGDAQIGWSILRAATTSTAATRLTADGNAPASYNTLNISINMSWLFDLDCVYRDTTNGATATWTFNRVLMTQGASAATTTVASAAATAGPTSGSSGASAPTVAADTTNGALALTFAAPNADAGHIVCGVTKLVIVK